MNFLFIIVTIERKVRFCVKLFDHFLTEYSSILAQICRILFQILWGFFHKISTINCFWKMFWKLLGLQGAPLSRLAEFCSKFCNFILSSYYPDNFWKHLHKYFHMSFLSSQEGMQKMKTQKNIWGRKARTLCARKKQVFQFFLLLVWEFYAFFLGVLIWNFYRTFLIVCIGLGWDLSLNFVPQDLQWIFYSSLLQLKGRFVSVWNCLIIF